MQRFAASRKVLSVDPHRPIYHFISPGIGMNDPNGLCFWQGQWHLFYQAFPPEDPRAHWGHAVSDDLIHWRDLPYAIAPDLEKECFSGATLVEHDRVIAMYHGTEAGNMIAIAMKPHGDNCLSCRDMIDVHRAVGTSTPSIYRSEGNETTPPAATSRTRTIRFLSTRHNFPAAHCAPR